jgi:hypothetical protein
MAVHRHRTVVANNFETLDDRLMVAYLADDAEELSQTTSARNIDFELMLAGNSSGSIMRTIVQDRLTYVT